MRSGRGAAAAGAGRAFSIASSVFGSTLTVDPSKYVRIAREPSPVRTASPATRTSPSVALTNDPVAPCLTSTSPEMTVTVVDAARARPPKPPPTLNAVNRRKPRTTGPVTLRRRLGPLEPPIHTTPADLSIPHHRE